MKLDDIHCFTFTVSLSFRVCLLDNIEVQMVDWWDRISITFNDLIDPISFPFTACLWHTARAVASFSPVHYGRDACHVPCECKTQASCFIVKNVRYAKAAGEVKSLRAKFFDYCFE